jgi:cytoskeletal protein RodZ
MNGRSNQGGSVASFIIIGVVLVIMTTGVLYWVRHKDAPIARESPTPEVTLPGNDVTTDDKKDETKSSEEDKSTSSPAPEETTKLESTSSTETTPTPQTDDAALPTTGPVDTALELIAIGALAIAGISFVRSRNHAASL